MLNPLTEPWLRVRLMWIPAVGYSEAARNVTLTVAVRASVSDGDSPKARL